jgi:hypothetical protein
MSSTVAPAPVTVRAVQPGDRDVWDQLFREYREFYKFSYDAKVLERAQEFDEHVSNRFVVRIYVWARFMTQFGIGCFRRPLCIPTFLTLVACLPAMQIQVLSLASRIIAAHSTHSLGSKRDSCTIYMCSRSCVVKV